MALSEIDCQEKPSFHYGHCGTVTMRVFRICENGGRCSAATMPALDDLLTASVEIVHQVSGKGVD
jgi:hypothetical protein